jgi:SAM-dependent methyltransferase
VLEIGSGTGWMLGAFRARGWTAAGSERSTAGAIAARDASGVPMFVGDLAAVRPGATCDLIVMFHVLEHLADPKGALLDAAARLRPGGALVLGVPNIGSWQARFAGRHWLHLDVPRHLCHFMPRRSGPVATFAALILAVPLGVIGLALAVTSWPLGAGALMEVWASRES